MDVFNFEVWPSANGNAIQTPRSRGETRYSQDHPLLHCFQVLFACYTGPVVQDCRRLSHQRCSDSFSAATFTGSATAAPKKFSLGDNLSYSRFWNLGERLRIPFSDGPMDPSSILRHRLDRINRFQLPPLQVCIFTLLIAPIRSKPAAQTQPSPSPRPDQGQIGSLNIAPSRTSISPSVWQEARHSRRRRRAPGTYRRRSSTPCRVQAATSSVQYPEAPAQTSIYHALPCIAAVGCLPGASRVDQDELRVVESSWRAQAGPLHRDGDALR